MLDFLVPLIKRAAREELLPRFGTSGRQFKADGSIVTEADVAMQTRLAAELRMQFPEYGLIGEEMDETERQTVLQQSESGVWCLDPVDGTSNFAAGLPFFSVSLALLKARRTELAVVYDPIRDECFTAKRGDGAWLNGSLLQCRPVGLPLSRCLAVVDFKRIPNLAAALVTHPPYGSQRNLGSVALEWCWLAAQRFHVYLHGRQQVWDYAAASLVFSEAGGFASTLDGEPVMNDALQPRSAVASCDAELYRSWLSCLAALRVAA